MQTMRSFLQELECPRCHHRVAADRLQTVCPQCQGPLFSRYALGELKQHMDKAELRLRRKGLWRWFELLPLQDARFMVTLGEGDCPLVQLTRLGERLGLTHLWLKDESLNPTGTFKARGLAVAISRAKELGAQRVIIPSAGNAGGAAAFYAARAGMEACVVVPVNTPRENLRECQAAGAKIIQVKGTLRDAGKLVQEISQREGWFDLATFREPYRLEGKKVMGLEIAEAFHWRLPDVIIYPTGGGTGLVGMWKAFEELRDLGWLEGERFPRMVSVQAKGCAPLVRAFENGQDQCQVWQGARTIASGLCVPKSFADREILQVLYQSRGTAISVEDEEILQAGRELAHTEGIFAAPEGAATLAGLKKLIARGFISPADRLVLFNTGTGLKYLSVTA